MKDAIRLFRKRKNNLILLLTKNKDEIELEKQHQIYGAINELDLLIQTLEKMNQSKSNMNEFNN